MNSDLKKQMKFEAHRKSVGLAYLLWFLFGILGVHRFYTGHGKSGLAQLLLTLTAIGLVISIPWVLIDLFLVPGLVRERNLETLEMLNIHDDGRHDNQSGRDEGQAANVPIDPRREAMLNDLRQTGYRKKPRNFTETYR